MAVASQRHVGPFFAKVTPLLSVTGSKLFLTNISTVTLSIVTNVLLARYGATSVYGADIPIAVIGIVFKVFGIIISIAVGIAVGGQPILGYNYGAGNMDRVKETFRKIMLCNLIVGVAATLLVEGIPHIIISWFVEGSELYIHYAVLAFRIYMGLILITCVTKATAIFFQSIGKPVTAIAVALSRDIVFLIPGLFIFAAIGGAEKGLETLLWAAPVSDVLSIVLCLALLARFFKANAVQNAVEDRKTAVAHPAVTAATGRVICIGRSYGAGGRTVGRLVAEKLGVPYYDSELLVKAAESSGLTRKYLESQDEKTVILAPLYQSIGFGTADYVPLEQKAACAQREIIEKIASEGPCVIVGRRADRILAGKANILSAFICGSEEARAKHVAEREHMTVKEASQLIAKADRERMMYYNQSTGARWGNPSSYDLCINTDAVSFETAADSIARLAQNV